MLQHTQPPGSQPSAAAGCSFGSQQDQLRQQEDAGAAGQVCYDMFSMFDLLADDDDVEQQQDHQQHNFSGSEQLHGMPLQHQPQHSQLLRPAAAPAAKQQPRLFSPSMADQALSSQQQQWRQRQPLAELLPVEHGDALAEAPALPTGKASARAHFGAAVQRSHKATSSLLSSLQRPSRPASQPPPSLKVLPPQTALADAAAASVGSVYGPASGDLLPLRSQPSHSMPLPQPSQQLLTPPHQIKPMFAEPAAGARWGATGSSNGSAAAGRLGQQGGQQPVADWAADNPGPGGQPHGGRELPDLGRFAFNAGRQYGGTLFACGWILLCRSRTLYLLSGLSYVTTAKSPAGAPATCTHVPTEGLVPYLLCLQGRLHQLQPCSQLPSSPQPMQPCLATCRVHSHAA